MNLTESSPTFATQIRSFQAKLYHELKKGARPIVRLMPLVAERANLEAAWERVRTAEGARTPGPDGVHCLDVQGQIDSWLNRLAEDLTRRRYHPQAPRLVEIPRPGEPQRPRVIGILSVRDRVVQTALKQALEPILDPIFLPMSFGFRPGRSVAGALQEALDLLADPRDGVPLTWAVHTDVTSCFDTIDHEFLREELKRHVADADVLGTIEDILHAGGTRTGRLWWKRTAGLVQGGALSPLLCNLALHPLDEAMQELSRSTQGAVRCLRYADDLLVLGTDARQVTRGLDTIRQVLRKRYQSLTESGVKPVSSGIEWLGVTIRRRAHHWGGPPAYGYAIPDAKVIDMLRRLTEMTAPPNEKIDGSAFNLSRWVVSINEQLRDWRQAYLFADNAPEVFRALDDHTRARVGTLIGAVTGERPGAVMRKYRYQLPRGFWTWEVPGARLVVLSSLAPHAPCALTRKPAWMKPPQTVAKKTPPKRTAAPLPASPKKPASGWEE